VLRTERPVEACDGVHPYEKSPTCASRSARCLLWTYVDPDGPNNVTPTQAGQALWIYHKPLNPDIAPFGLGLAVFLAYVVVLLAAAFARFRYSDA
jgi:hypothetical protein